MATSLALDSLPGERAGAVLTAVVVADDALSGRRLVTALRADGMRVVTAARPEDVSAVSEPLTPDAVVFAADLSCAIQMTALRGLRRSTGRCGIVVVVPASLRIGSREALNNGADGFLLDSDVERTLAIIVRAVAAGHVSVPRHLRRSLVTPAFSYRERQVLALVVKGFQNREIADSLFLAESTVKSHLASSFAKLGVRSRKEAATILLDPTEGLQPLILDDAR